MVTLYFFVACAIREYIAIRKACHFLVNLLDFCFSLHSVKTANSQLFFRGTLDLLYYHEVFYDLRYSVSIVLLFLCLCIGRRMQMFRTNEQCHRIIIPKVTNPPKSSYL